MWRLRYQNLLGPGHTHDSIPCGAGSAMALPGHMVCGVEGVGACLPGASGGKTRGIDTRNHDKRCTVFPPWTVTRDVWHAALRPDVSGVAVDALLFNEAGLQLVHRYRVYKDPFTHPALRDGVIPRLLSCVGRAMTIARLDSSPDFDPIIRGSSRSGARGVLSGRDGPRFSVSSPPRVVRG